MNKQALRAWIRQQKRAMTPEEIALRSMELCRMAAETEAYRNAEALYGYLPFNQEVRVLPLLRKALADGKQVALPRCQGRDMHFIWMSDLSRIRPGALGAPEPVDADPLAEDETALVLVPGLAFCPSGHRLGYGGGYYDRFLSREPSHPTIALCYDFQLVPTLEPEPHDIPVDLVLYR